MVFGLSRQFRHPSRLLGLLAVLVSLVGQLSLGQIVLRDERPNAALAALEAATSFCHTGGNTGGRDRPPIPHRPADCALCPLCITLALPAVIPAADLLLSEPSRSHTLRPFALPQARAPPSHGFAAAYPRGPPRLV